MLMQLESARNLFLPKQTKDDDVAKDWTSKEKKV